MPRPSFGFLTAAVLVLLTGPALAEDRYWVGGSGDWFDPANWSATPAGPGGAGVPIFDQYAYVTHSDGLDRLINYSTPSESTPSLASLRLDATGLGSVTLQLQAGRLYADEFLIGFAGRAALVQTGGTIQSNSLTLADTPLGGGTYQLQDGGLYTIRTSSILGTSSFIQAGGTHQTSTLDLAGSYDLQGGQLSTTNSYVRAPGTFTQSGGTHELYSLLDVAGTYSLSAGDLAVPSFSRVSGVFRQDGGTHSTAALELAASTSRYEWTGGDLTIQNNWRVRAYDSTPVTFAFPAAPRSLTIDGIVDIGPHNFTNANQVSVSMGPQSLLIVDPGYDPASEFASFANAGVTHIKGTTLTIPAGQTITGRGIIEDPVEIQGSVTKSSSSGSVISLTGPAHITAGATLQGVDIATENAASLMDGGTLSGNVKLGGSYPGTFTQTGGSINGDVYLGGASAATPGSGQVLYELQDGVLNAYREINVGYARTTATVPVRFHQSGGVISTRDSNGARLTIASDNPEAPAVYELSGGTLDIAGCSLADNGTLAITDPTATVRFSGFVSIAPGGQIRALPGTTIHFVATAWFNASTQPELLEDLRHVTFVFENDSIPGFFQAASRDLGPHIAGFTNNFALGTLQLGGDEGFTRLVVQDHIDNFPDDPNPEAVYVKHLILNPASILYAQGRTVYYYRLTNNGGTIVENGGQFIQVPVLPGDSSGDNLVNSLDIPAFIQAMMSPTAYELAYPHADHLAMNDLNADGYVNSLDIHLFIQALMQPPAPASSPVPEPASALAMFLLAASLANRCFSRTLES